LLQSWRLAEVAQSVEQWTENPCVASSILALGTIIFRRPTGRRRRSSHHMGTLVALLGFGCLGTISLILLLRPHVRIWGGPKYPPTRAPVQRDPPPPWDHDDLGLRRRRGGQGAAGHSRSNFNSDARRRKPPHSAASEADFRVRPGTGQQGPPKWDPYAEDQSSSHRVREARKGRSPHRSHRPDYYEILGVLPTASTQEIDTAYRRCAARVHPDQYFADQDRRAEAEKALKKINAAVQVLRDPSRRARYDARHGYR
jgi:hypothetical protein